MTRKDYIAIAGAIRATQERIRYSNGDSSPIRDQQLRGVRRAAAHLADALAEDNPRFDPARFLKECGYGSPREAQIARLNALAGVDENGSPLP